MARWTITPRSVSSAPAKRLGFVVAPQRFQCLGAGKLPFEGDIRPAFRINLLEGFQCFLSPSRRDQTVGDVSRDHRRSMCPFRLLRNIGIHITLGVGYFMERDTNDQILVIAVNLVHVDGASAAPADDLLIFLGRLLLGLVRPADKESLETLQSFIRQRRHHCSNQPVELAVSIAWNCLEYLLGQDIGIDIRRLGDRAGVGAGLMEALDQRAAAIVRSLK